MPRNNERESSTQILCHDVSNVHNGDLEMRLNGGQDK